MHPFAEAQLTAGYLFLSRDRPRAHAHISGAGTLASGMSQCHISLIEKPTKINLLDHGTVSIKFQVFSRPKQ